MCFIYFFFYTGRKKYWDDLKYTTNVSSLSTPYRYLFFFCFFFFFVLLINSIYEFLDTVRIGIIDDHDHKEKRREEEKKNLRWFKAKKCQAKKLILYISRQHTLIVIHYIWIFRTVYIHRSRVLFSTIIFMHFYTHTYLQSTL